jgi:hypothetical protein
MLLTAGSAQALNFDFSFTGDFNPGTVTGEIEGLSVGTGPASAVIVDSTTNGGLSVPALFGTDVGPNLFTVSNLGAITAGTFYGKDSLGDQLLVNIYNQIQLQVNALYTASGHGDVTNIIEINGNMAYTPAPVPELPIPLMLSAGMLVPVLARRARKRRLG